MAEASNERKPRGTARVAFLAHRDAIIAALEKGHTASTVYQQLQAKLASAISYPQFVRYVRILRDDGTAPHSFGQMPVAAPSPAAQAHPPAPPRLSATPPQLPLEGPVHAGHQPRRAPSSTTESRGRTTKPASLDQAAARTRTDAVTAVHFVLQGKGGASFLPFSRYLVENDISAVLREHATPTVVHAVVTGGGNSMDTLKGLDALVRHFAPGAEIVVWINRTLAKVANPPGSPQNR
jgi:hypothetical protein